MRDLKILENYSKKVKEENQKKILFKNLRTEVNTGANGSEFAEMRKKNSEFWKEVMSEDIKAIEGMQEGRNSTVYNGGNFSPIMDNPTHQFHKWVANNLTE